MIAAEGALSLLGEDEHRLYLAKPAGLPVFPPHADARGDCVLARLLRSRPEQGERAFPAGFEGGIAHRLDNPTSGLLVVARSPEALSRLREQFAEKQLQKRYLFLSAREVPWERHHVRTPLAHDARRRDRMIVQRGAATPHRGRWYEADTRLRRLGLTPLGALWEAVIRTGVMHQIRAHAASVGLALRGDTIYGGGARLSEALLPGIPPEVPFLLHHRGLSFPDADEPSPRCPVPAFWPPLPGFEDDVQR